MQYKTDLPDSSKIHAEFHTLKQRLFVLVREADVPVDVSAKVDALRDDLMALVDSRDGRNEWSNEGPY